MRTLTGIQPSGSLHIGNYFGAMRPAIEAQARGECFYFIADYHSMTSLFDPAQRRKNVTEAALDWLACGLDPQRAVFWRQSDVPQVTELTWLLGSLTPMGLLERAHSYKDKTAKGVSPNFGLFAYPVLMAADILLFDTNRVPVGKDQKQHLEMTRDIAIKFNQAYGETRKKIMGIVMDSRTPAEPKPDAEKNLALILLKLVAPADVAADYENRLRAGGLGYGDLKKALFEHYWNYFASARARRAELAANLDHVAAVLREGAERARTVADGVLQRARKASGLE